MDLITESAAEALARCEIVLREWERSTLAAAGALREIHNLQLYREKGYKTFEAYVNSEWLVHTRRAYRMMAAHDARETLLCVVPDAESLINTERQLRELSGLSKREVNAVLQESIVQCRGTDRKWYSSTSLASARVAVIGKGRRSPMPPPASVDEEPESSDEGVVSFDSEETGGAAQADAAEPAPVPAPAPSEPPAYDTAPVVIQRAKRISKANLVQLRLQLSHLGLRKRWEAVLKELEREIDDR